MLEAVSILVLVAILLSAMLLLCFARDPTRDDPVDSLRFGSGRETKKLGGSVAAHGTGRRGLLDRRRARCQITRYYTYSI